MKKELDHEKSVLKQFWDDFEHQHASMEKREKELSTQYAALSQQMEEQYALQSSTAKIVEDYQETIQQLNKAIKEQRTSFQKDIDDLQSKVEGYENKVRGLQNQLDETRDVVRSQRQEIEARDHLVMETQEKLKRAQKQLHQIKMESLESRVTAISEIKDGVGEFRPGHRRNMSRRSASATYTSMNSTDWMKAAEPVLEELPSLEKTNIQKTEGSVIDVNY
jgi:chromosome segregation ATPase